MWLEFGNAFINPNLVTALRVAHFEGENSISFLEVITLGDTFSEDYTNKEEATKRFQGIRKHLKSYHNSEDVFFGKTKC